MQYFPLQMLLAMTERSKGTISVAHLEFDYPNTIIRTTVGLDTMTPCNVLLTS